MIPLTLPFSSSMPFSIFSLLSLNSFTEQNAMETHPVSAGDESLDLTGRAFSGILLLFQCLENLNSVGSLKVQDSYSGCNGFFTQCLGGLQGIPLFPQQLVRFAPAWQTNQVNFCSSFRPIAAGGFVLPTPTFSLAHEGTDF